MKNAIVVATLVLGASAAEAQQLELPRPSPTAHVSQTIGVTDITVDYSSPAVNGRPIWGALVPYDKVWRTGANAATKLTFSKDVLVADKPVPAGSYALFTIPGKSSWTVILNKNFNQNGSTGYKESDDLLRFTATPQASAPRERLAFLFADFDNNHAALELEWERLRLTIPVRAKTDEQALASIRALSDGGWRPWNSAARYLLEVRKDPDAGLMLVEKSLALHEDWLNLFTKAQLLAMKHRYPEATALAEKAQSLGAHAEQFFLADEVKKSLADWKARK